MLTLTPVVCVLSAIALSKTLEFYLKDDKTKGEEEEMTSQRMSQSRTNEQRERSDKYYDKVHVHFTIKPVDIFLTAPNISCFFTFL